ncbi:hypothetical protein F5Y17DRAFT_441338 [Xylariaceae sp. FL0594]|nr:hypothetical protein F5Y17DRAFT_441338 [Xylariaceae sp. FL0594]
MLRCINCEAFCVLFLIFTGSFARPSSIFLLSSKYPDLHNTLKAACNHSMTMQLLPQTQFYYWVLAPASNNMFTV